jgi:hypothetical protein
MDSKKKKPIEWWGVVLILGSVLVFGYHLYALGARAFAYSFGQDDLQHTHIAWNVFRGKIIFKDFFEHHGPVFAWLNALLLWIKPGVVESAETLTYLRLFPLLMAGVTAMMVGITVSTLTQGSRKIAKGTVAGALFLSLRIVQGTAFQTRPDITVGFLCVLFLFLLSREKRLLAGMCLGLALGFHPKFLPLNLGFLLADQVALGFKVPIRRRLALFWGEMILLGIIGLVLAIQGALYAAIDHMFLMNLNLISKRVVEKTEVVADLFFKLWKSDPVLLLLFLALFVGSIVSAILNKKTRTPLRYLLLIAALSCGLFLLSPIHEYALLLILPLMVVFVFQILLEIPWGKFEPVVLGGLLAVALLNTALALPLEMRNETQKRREQIEVLSTALYKLRRTDPVFYVWFSRCPAYVFNEDSQAQWLRSPRSMDEVDQVLPGFPVSGSRAQESRLFEKNRLEEENIQYVAIDEFFMGKLSQVERTYLTDGFAQDLCLWTRS